MKDLLAFCFRTCTVAIGFATVIALGVIVGADNFTINEVVCDVSTAGLKCQYSVCAILLASCTHGLARYIFIGEQDG